MTCTSETARIIAKAASGEALQKDEIVRLLTLASPEETEALFQAAGALEVRTEQDLAGLDRVVLGKKSPLETGR